MFYKRPFFDPNAEYVAVKLFPRSGGEAPELGMPVKARTNLLRNWYKVGRLGVRGDPWTEAQLKAQGFVDNVLSDDEQSDKSKPKKKGSKKSNKE